MVVVTEIPYGVQKSRLIEQLATLLTERKAHLLGDVRDKSAEDVRVVLEPRSRTIDPAMMMEQLYKLSELETRIPVNLNVLVDGVTPRVIGFGEALQQWLDHRRAVLQRRSAHRLAAIDRRLELLAGMIVVFLNLDEVIRIVREDDEPKAALMARFALTETQANYILDTRLRSLRRLEEMALRKERKDLEAEKGSIETLLASEKKQWQAVAYEIRDVRKKFGPDTKLGRRRTTFEIADRDRGRTRRGADRARAGDDPHFAEGLDPRAERSRRRPRERDFQGRGRVADLVLRRDHVENPGAGDATARPSPSTRPSCRAAAAPASRSG